MLMSTLKLDRSAILTVTIFSLTLFLSYALRLYLNVNYQKDYELLTFIPFFIVLCFGIMSGLLQEKKSSHFNFQFYLKKNFSIFFFSILVFTILTTLLFFVKDLQSGHLKIFDSIFGGVFSGFEMILIFFIGYIVGVSGRMLSKFF